MLMLLGVGEYGFVLEKGLDLEYNDGGKVVVVLVDAKDSGHDIADLFERIPGGEFLCLEQIIFGDIEVVLGGVLRGVVIAIVFVIGKGLLRMGRGKDGPESQRRDAMQFKRPKLERGGQEARKEQRKRSMLR
jgi:hypothetical protein